MMAYDLKFKKAVNHVIELNQNLTINDEKLREKSY